MLVMKAASSEPRCVNLLRQEAEENDLHVWHARHAVYLLPAISPAHEAVNRRKVMH